MAKADGMQEPGAVPRATRMSLTCKHSVPFPFLIVGSCDMNGGRWRCGEKGEGKKKFRMGFKVKEERKRKRIK